MSQLDRVTGLVGYSGVKVPVDVCSTTNLTLTGEQTVDGVLTAESRILLTGQTDQTENGIWVTDAGDWSRAQDCDGPYDLRQGSMVNVYGGTSNLGFWQCTAADPVDIETDNITFGRASSTLVSVSAYWQGVLGQSTAALARAALVAASAVITTKGDLYVGGAAGAEARKAVGADGARLYSDSTQTDGLKWNTINALTTDSLPVAAADYVETWDASAGAPKKVLLQNLALSPTGYISGGTYQNNATDATNDLDIAAGRYRDATDAVDISCSALTKQSDAAWAVGTAAGGLDTGAVGNNDYYIWAIKRSDTGVCDYLFSLSSTAPTMPTNYDYKRLMGWFKRSGGTIVAFKTYETHGGGIELAWTVPTLDINLANTLTTARRTDAVKVPLNVSTIARLNVVLQDAGVVYGWICNPDQTDAAPSQTAAPLASLKSQVAGDYVQGQMDVRTSAAGLIAARGSVATVDLYAVVTLGFTWARRV